MSETVTAAVLIIGNEILSGRTQDANLAYLAKGLNDAGVRLSEARVVADTEDAIVDAVNALRTRHAYVFTTGGIGPTHDDITAECVAKAFGLPLTRHPEAFRRLQEHYERTGVELNEARLRMANTPEGADLIDNPVSAAPGFRVENVYVMAGVPRICEAMFDGLKDGLKGGTPMQTRTVHSALPEGQLAEGLGAIQARYGELDVGSYPSYRPGGFGVAVVLRGTNAERLDQATAEVADLVRSLGAEPDISAD